MGAAAFSVREGSSIAGMNNATGGMATSGSLEGAMIWIIIAAVIAVIGGIVLYFTFLARKNDGKFKGFLGWVYDFFSFKKFTIETILRLTYLILAIFITLASFASISTSPLAFLLILTVGNLALRIVYEFSLIMLIICRNTTEINNKLNKKDE